MLFKSLPKYLFFQYTIFTYRPLKIFLERKLFENISIYEQYIHSYFKSMLITGYKWVLLKLRNPLS